MATNDFLPFAGGAGANVLTQAAYVAQAALRSNGFSAGTAQSAQLNKVWRQSSIMAAALAQMISDNTGADVLDDGTTATILANLENAVAGRLIRVQVFTANGVYTPTAGTKSVVVEAVGGGGSGGACPATATNQAAAGGGGGAGSYGKARFTTGFSGVTVTIGQGGSAPAAGLNNGSPGSATSFGALLSCPGGTAGNAGAVLSASGASGVNGGNATGPSGANVIGFGGEAGANGVTISSAQALAGKGGSSSFGSGGHYPTSGGARSGTGYGSGSSGVNSSQNSAATAGLAGQPGIVIVYEYA